MPKIPDEVVKRVIDLARIEDVVSDFVELRKAGVNLTGICPFHDDKHDGNFIVRPSSIPEARHGTPTAVSSAMPKVVPFSSLWRMSGYHSPTLSDGWVRSTMSQSMTYR